jgi:hypothetical protein
VEESVESSLGEQADADSAHLLELIRDYLALISSVKVSPELAVSRLRLYLVHISSVKVSLELGV